MTEIFVSQRHAVQGAAGPAGDQLGLERARRGEGALGVNGDEGTDAPVEALDARQVLLGRLDWGDLPRRDREAWVGELARRYPNLPPSLLRALAHRHGTRAVDVLGDARTGADLGTDFGADLTAREVDYLVREEWALTAEDVLWRRTKCGLPMTQAQSDAVSAYL